MYTLPPGAPKPPPVANTASYMSSQPYAQPQFNNTAYMQPGGGIPQVSSMMHQNMPPPPVSMPPSQTFRSEAPGASLNKCKLLDLCITHFCLKEFVKNFCKL